MEEPSLFTGFKKMFPAEAKELARLLPHFVPVSAGGMGPGAQ